MKSSLTRRILLSWGADVVTTVIGFLGTIYLARSLGAAPLGIFALSVSVMHWLRVSDLGVTQAAIKRISEGGNQSEIISATVLIQALQTGLVVGGLIVFRGPVNDYIGGEFALLIGGLFLVNRLLNGVSRQILNGYQVVHISSALTATDRILRTVFQVALVVLGFEVLGLFLGMGLSLILVGAAGLLFVYRIVDLEFVLPTRESFKYIYDYARYSVLSVVKSEAFSWTDIVVMGFFVQSSVIGIYNVSWSIAMAFLMLGTAMQKNLFPEISGLSEVGNDEKTQSLISESLIYAGLFPIAGVVGAAILGDSILSIYGTEFTEGKYILVLLIIVAWFRAYEKQIHALLDGIDRPDLTFNLNLVFTVTNICLNVLLVPFYGAIGAAVATILSLALNIALGWHTSTQLISVHFPLIEIAKQIVAAGVMGAVVLAAKSVLPPQNIYVLFSLVGIGAVIYFGILLTLSKNIRTKIYSVINQQLV
jgi:O-antigen/teichoic acid export membrane protein